MEQNRTLLILLLCFVAYLMYQQWQSDYGPKPPAPKAAPTPAAQNATPAMPVAGTTSSNTSSTSSVVPSTAVAQEKGQRIKIETDVYRAEIDTLGGDLSEVDLLKYPVAFNRKDEPFRLMETGQHRFFIAQSGWYLPNDAENNLVAGSRTIYHTEQTSYKLANGQNELSVDLTWQNAQGIVFTKRYVFHRDSYLIDVTHIVSNPSKSELKTNLYLRIQRNAPATKSGFFALPNYVGPVYYSPDHKYKKVSFNDIDGIKDSNVKDAINRSFSGGWAAVIEQFFLGAWIPPANETFKYFTSKTDEANHHYMIGMVTEKTIPAGQKDVQDTAKLFVGPKLQKQLGSIAPGLEYSMDYGWVRLISEPLFWGLDKIHSNILPNWGWAIIFLTILVKGVFYKLSETSYRSMARMKNIAPRLTSLKERYADDKQKMNQAMMDLYKTEKINPLGGCLPILIQIPVFIALYYVLLESVELRQAPWILWIQDLSIMDPYFVLPILMGITMVAQQKLNPAPVDPMQAKIMMVLPLMFTVMFAVFPSGLVLYWVVSNLLSIAQQWYITKHVLAEEKHTSGHHTHRDKAD